jgi:hypothetical protein
MSLPNDKDMPNETFRILYKNAWEKARKDDRRDSVMNVISINLKDLNM